MFFLEFHLSEKLGGNTRLLKKQVLSEISRGISAEKSYQTIARNISNYGQANLNRTMRIVRTESGRIHSKATSDSIKAVKERGADVVKQWDSTLDGNTRLLHRQLDGKYCEVDEPFEVSGLKVMYPGGFGTPSEDCNCRCRIVSRARLAVEGEKTYSKMNNLTGELIKCSGYKDFEKKYLERLEKEESHKNIVRKTQIDKKFINSAKFTKKFEKLNESEVVIKEIKKQSVDMLNHRNGTLFEDLVFINSKTGETLVSNQMNLKQAIRPTKKMNKLLKRSEPNTVIAIHNHPESSLPSLSDIGLAYARKYKYGLVVGHNGTVYKYAARKNKSLQFFRYLLDKQKEIGYDIKKYKKQMKESGLILEVL